METQRVTFPLYNLCCGGGGSLVVERALQQLRGVQRAYVNPATEMVYVEYDPAATGPAHLRETLQHAGFGPPANESSPPSPVVPTQAPARLDVRRMALTGGCLLALLLVLCVAADRLFPGVSQMGPLWTLVLIGYDWTELWTLPLGLVQAFLYGALGAGALALFYNAAPARAAH
jgi:cation transport ATPase